MNLDNIVNEIHALESELDTQETKIINAPYPIDFEGEEMQELRRLSARLLFMYKQYFNLTQPPKN